MEIGFYGMKIPSHSFESRENIKYALEKIYKYALYKNGR
ncbi:Uncharacterised protein [Staphylococcus aureus]|nr:Uncharacterised protein [Staphylococcus aureus]